MVREKGAMPSRRLPSRSGRASFETDPSEPHDSSAGPSFSNNSGSSTSSRQQENIDGAIAAPGPSSSASPSAELGTEDERDNRSASNGSGGTGTTTRTTGWSSPAPINSSSNSRKNDANVAGSGAPSTPATPRGRGRPRKKPLAVKVDGEGSAMPPVSPRASELQDTVGDAPAPSGAPTARRARATAVDARARHNHPGDGNVAEQVGTATVEGEHDGGEEANESDEWSDDDEVHHLPRDVKAQFGNVVWAKCRGNPPWPGLVWDPRFLGKDKASRSVARVAYAALRKSHLVKFYDIKGSFAAVPYKRVSPFDAVEMPVHLKACGTAKMKESLKEDVQEASAASLLTRSERLAAMHEIGRFDASKKKKAPKSAKKQQPKPAAAAPAAAAPPVDPPKKRGRGRPRKAPIKELDADAPSPSSSGAEYELEVPEEPEQADQAGIEGGEGAAEEDGAAGDMEVEEEEDEEDEEMGGDDDDEEEYTADGEPEEEEDDHNFEENFASPKAGRKRGRPRKSGGRGGKASEGTPAQKRPRAKSVSPRAGSSKGHASDGSEGGWANGGNSGSGKSKPMVPGEAKARALAVVQAFVATLPPAEYGRDEGWTASNDEARAVGDGGGGGGGGGSGGKRQRAGGEGGQAREKKPKKLKSSREERERDESDSKQRLLQMKNSREPIWKQHRRITEKGNGGASGGGSETGENTTKVPVLTPVAVAATGSVAGAGGKGGSRESQVEAGKKLTQKLAKSSAEGRFSRKDVLDILQKLGELDPSVELLQQSGCGKAVASVRKYFSGGQVKHNDKDVASTASSLRARWVDTLGKGTPSTPSGNVGDSSSTDVKFPPQAPTPTTATPSRAGAEPGHSSSRKQQTAQSISEESPRARSPKTIGGSGSGAAREVKRENGSRGSSFGGGGVEGGRYGSAPREEDEAGRERTAAKREVKKEVKKETKSETKSETASAAAASATPMLPAAVVTDEPRRRAMGMLMSVLGSAASAVERCTAIEEALHESQGKKISKEYLRRLRTAVFSMEGSDSQRLRDKVMSEMVLPRDFVTKSRDELHSLAGMV